MKETSSAAHFYRKALLLQRRLLPAAVILTVLQDRERIRRIMLMLLE